MRRAVTYLVGVVIILLGCGTASAAEAASAASANHAGRVSVHEPRAEPPPSDSYGPWSEPGELSDLLHWNPIAPRTQIQLCATLMLMGLLWTWLVVSLFEPRPRSVD